MNENGLSTIYRCLTLSTIAFAMPSCQSKEPPPTKSAESHSVRDTTLQVHKGNQTWSMRIPKGNVEYFDGFQAMIDTLNSTADSGWTELMVDVTGDGIPQRYVSTWKLSDSDVVIRNFIMSKQGIIWKDSLEVEDMFGFALPWNKDSSYFRLKPYSAIFVAFKELHGVIGDSEVNQSVLEDAPTRESLLEYHTLAYWRRYLSHFRGRTVQTLGMDPAECIWDKELGKFIPLH